MDGQQTEIKFGSGIFGQSNTLSRTLIGVKSQSELSADTKSINSGEQSPNNISYRGSGVITGYNESKAEKDLYSLAKLENVSPSRVQIKITREKEETLPQSQVPLTQIESPSSRMDQAVPLKLATLTNTSDNRLGSINVNHSPSQSAFDQ